MTGIAGSSGYEFDALAEARNYRAALAAEFAEQLRGRVIEVGAGVGQFTALLRERPEIESLTVVEPERGFCQRLRAQFPGLEVREGTVAGVEASGGWDAVISVNVLEHIANDAGELAAYRRLLGARGGSLCLFVPARPELMAPIDRDFGHHRRYTRRGLRRLLIAAEFDVVRLDYFNCVGYIAWWLVFRLLARRRFNPAAVRAFDRWIFPWMHAFEARVFRPPLGQSLVAVARSRVEEARISAAAAGCIR